MEKETVKFRSKELNIRRKPWYLKIIRPELTAVLLLIISFIVSSLITPYFADIKYLFDSTSLYVEFGIIAIAWTLILIAGQLDISISSSMALSAVVMAKIYNLGVSMVLTIIIGLILGIVLGFFNGILVTKTGLPSLIVTIGTLALYRGIAQVIAGDFSLGGFPVWFNSIDQRYIFKIVPLPLIIFIIFSIILWFILRYTFFGRKVYAIGTNENAALYSGVKVNVVKIILFSLVGFSASLAGIITMSRLNLARYSIGLGGELDIITIVLLGGTSISGGSGSILGTFIAFFTLIVLRNGMSLANLKRFDQLAIIGVVLIVIMIISSYLDKFIKNREL